MTDIVERLRKATLYQGHGELSDLPEEAANTALRAKVERLEADLATARADALEEAARCVRRMPAPASDWMADELLRALGGPANKIPAAIRRTK